MSYTPNSTRYTAMMYRNAGKSGLKLPAISLGFWHNFGNYNNVQDMKAICFAAFDNGVTHFDLANNYGFEVGAAERNLGRILTEDLHAYRDELVISTKAGFEIWPGPYGRGGSRKYLSLCIDKSLDRWVLIMLISSITNVWTGILLLKRQCRLLIRLFRVVRLFT